MTTTQIEVLAAIRRAIEETHTAAIYITHDLAVVAQIADDIMVLRNGETVEYGPTEQIIVNPREDYTRALTNVGRDIKPQATDQSDILLQADQRSTATAALLHDVSMSVARGQTLSIVGKSGRANRPWPASSPSSRRMRGRSPTESHCRRR